jgi:hypothetical protein
MLQHLSADRHSSGFDAIDFRKRTEVPRRPLFSAGAFRRCTALYGFTHDVVGLISRLRQP